MQRENLIGPVHLLGQTITLTSLRIVYSWLKCLGQGQSSIDRGGGALRIKQGRQVLPLQQEVWARWILSEEAVGRLTQCSGLEC